MFVKLELDTPRVKGLCFHQTRNWLLASFHTGEIVIYDYEAGVIVQQYEPENKAAVRSVDFHPSLPMFCSGSDDNCVRVYNYEKQRCICTFKDHLDFIRTVQFHPTHPFIVSASDDQTIRIFNWETRTSVSILSGHNHYVMSAFFHPTQPLILSASLDDTVRVWDVSALFAERGGGLFALTDAVLKFQQEEHVSGVNWAAWHPTRPLAVSCSDDQSIKIWKYSDTELSVIATLRNHSNNVSCAIYHPVVDVVLSASEDKTVRVWDAKRFLNLTKYRRQSDRFWILAAHPKLPLFAAGHDSGLTVFRLMRQRPTYDVCKSDVYYYKDGSIRKYNIDDQSDTVVGQTKPRFTGNRASPLDPPPRSFCYSPSHNKLLVGHEEKFEIHALGGSGQSEQKVDVGTQPVWFSRNQLAWIGEGGNTQLCVREVNGVSVTKVTIPATRYIFPASTGMLFLATQEHVTLFDVTRKQIVTEKTIPNVKFSYISPDRKRVAFIGGTSVTIASIDLSTYSTFQDGAKVKSGAWFEGYFIYSTKTHVKYLLPTGDSGIIRSISERLCIVAVREKHVFCLDDELAIRRVDVDFTECRFKTALAEGNMAKVSAILKYAKLCSDSIIDYLEQHGHPEIALCFVEDPAVKFKLAIEAGDLKTAVDAAVKVDDPATWDRLVDEAMRHGRFSVAEVALKKSGNLEKLAFFYLISGQVDKLNSLKVDDSLALQRAIWLNDRGTIGNLLKDVSPSLSYVAAKTSGNEELAEALALEEDVKTVLDARITTHDLTNTGISTGTSDDWPLLFVSEPQFSLQQHEALIDEEDIGEGWGSAGIVDDDEGKGGEDDVKQDDEENGWDLGLDMDDTMPASSGAFVAPVQGESMQEKWMKKTHVPGEIAAAGFFGQALLELQRQIGLMNAEPLKPHFIEAYQAANATVTMFANVPSLTIPISVESGYGLAPARGLSISALKEELNRGYNETRRGAFASALVVFKNIIQSIPLIICNTEAEKKEVLGIVKTCREYIIGLSMQLEIKSSSNNARKAELAVYFTHCKLQPAHLMLTLKSALSIATKSKFMGLAASVAKRIAAITKAPTDLQRARKLEEDRKQEAGKEPHLNYDERNPFKVCCGSMTPIYKGLPRVICPFCRARYQPQYRSSLCKVCELCSVGADVPGLTLVRPRRD